MDDKQKYMLIGADMGKMQMSLAAALAKAKIDPGQVIYIDSLGGDVQLEMLEEDMKVRFENLKIKAPELPALETIQMDCTPDQYNNRAGRRLREKNKRKRGW